MQVKETLNRFPKSIQQAIKDIMTNLQLGDSTLIEIIPACKSDKTTITNTMAVMRSLGCVVKYGGRGSKYRLVSRSIKFKSLDEWEHEIAKRVARSLKIFKPGDLFDTKQFIQDAQENLECAPQHTFKILTEFVSRSAVTMLPLEQVDNLRIDTIDYDRIDQLVENHQRWMMFSTSKVDYKQFQTHCSQFVSKLEAKPITIKPAAGRRGRPPREFSRENIQHLVKYLVDWKSKSELIQELESIGIKVSKSNWTPLVQRLFQGHDLEQAFVHNETRYRIKPAVKSAPKQVAKVSGQTHLRFKWLIRELAESVQSLETFSQSMQANVPEFVDQILSTTSLASEYSLYIGRYDLQSKQYQLIESHEFESIEARLDYILDLPIRLIKRSSESIPMLIQVDWSQERVKRW